MKLKKTNKYKVEIAIGIAFMFLISSWSVMSTITQTDKITSTDDSGLVINYEEGWINTWNITVDNVSYDADEINQWKLAFEHIGDDWFNASKAATITNDMMLGWNASNVTKICNSNGKYWEATEANLQSAIDDLGTDGGWVEIPADTTINISSSIELDNNIWLRGGGKTSVIRLADNANVTVLTNEDTVGGNHNITITDLCIDGNGPGQDSAGTYVENHPYQCVNGIYFKYVDNYRIENCVIKYPTVMGIYTHFCTNGMIRGNDISYYGSEWEGTATEWYVPIGIFGDSESGTDILENDCHDGYSCGIVLEHRTVASDKCIINNNRCWNNFYGIYLETVTNVTVNSNVVYDNNKDEAYVVPAYAGGIRFGSGGEDKWVNNSIISNNILNNNGDISASNGYSIVVSGKNNIITDNVITESSGYGIYYGEGYSNSITNNIIDVTGLDGMEISCLNSIINNNIIKNAGDEGIYLTYYVGVDPDENDLSEICNNEIYNTADDAIISVQSNTIINNNNINGVGGDGIFLSTVINNTVSGNIITDGDYANDAIEPYGAVDCVFIGNIMSGFLDGIDEKDVADYNIYVGNNARCCTNGFDFNGANNNVTANMGTHI